MFHAFLAFFLLLQKFALAGDVATITFGGNVLAYLLDGFTGDNLGADGYCALKPCKIKLIYFLFCLGLFEKGYHVDGIVNDSTLNLHILLTEHFT